MEFFLSAIVLGALCFFLWITYKERVNNIDLNPSTNDRDSIYKNKKSPLIIEVKKKSQEKYLSDEEREKLRNWIAGPRKYRVGGIKDTYLKAYESGDPKDLTKIARRKFNKWKKEYEALKAAYDDKEHNPDLNTYNIQQHFRRLRRFNRSKYRWTMEYMGPKGGIYTYTANGNKSYR